ncbi:hypothetical protein [Burkholderia ubonensis]|uniref:hypothetical protein n=1 Tax=Burkholderia ubonensis TaxID=101571 RepID=UPI0012FC33A0|nr:hypothetical protein [Burkholderia ubonensis]
MAVRSVVRLVAIKYETKMSFGSKKRNYVARISIAEFEIIKLIDCGEVRFLKSSIMFDLAVIE